MTKVRLVSANIEGDLHLDLVVRFLDQQAAGIVCLQEVFRDDLPLLVGSAYRTEFLPMSLKVNRHGDCSEWGIAIASRITVRNAWQAHYYQPPAGLVPFDERAKRLTIAHGVAGMHLRVGNSALTVVTTHFTWTPDGASDFNQDMDIGALLKMLKSVAPHVLCGDFNIPRQQNRHYQTLTEHYTDHVPRSVVSSIHVPLHAARHKPGVAQKLEQFMVDYIFSTPRSCAVTNAELHGGISDHMALTADIAPQVPA